MSLNKSFQLGVAFNQPFELKTFRTIQERDYGQLELHVFKSGGEIWAHTGLGFRKPNSQYFVVFDRGLDDAGFRKWNRDVDCHYCSRKVCLINLNRRACELLNSLVNVPPYTLYQNNCGDFVSRALHLLREEGLVAPEACQEIFDYILAGFIFN